MVWDVIVAWLFIVECLLAVSLAGSLAIAVCCGF